MSLRQRWQRWRESRVLARRAIPDALWQQTLADHPFLQRLGADDAAELRRLASLFLDGKEFTAAGGLELTDAMAVTVAAQACLPVLRLGLAPYAGFVGIVLHPAEVVARREHPDEDGVVHAWDEPLAGEAMEGGPLMLAWSEVKGAGETARWGYNVVIHEFTHVLDMALAAHPACDATTRARWQRTMTEEYEAFVARVDADEYTLLDPYGAEAPQEYFAVAAEAFFVTPVALRTEHPATYAVLAEFFLQDPAAR